MAKPVRLTLFPLTLDEHHESRRTGVAVARDVLHVGRNCRNLTEKWMERGFTPPEVFSPKLRYLGSDHTRDGRGNRLCCVMPHEMKRFMSEGWYFRDGYFSGWQDRPLRGYLSEMYHDSTLVLYFT